MYHGKCTSFSIKIFKLCTRIGRRKNWNPNFCTTNSCLMFSVCGLHNYLLHFLTTLLTTLFIYRSCSLVQHESRQQCVKRAYRHQLQKFDSNGLRVISRRGILNCCLSPSISKQALFEGLHLFQCLVTLLFAHVLTKQGKYRAPFTGIPMNFDVALYWDSWIPRRFFM